MSEEEIAALKEKARIAEEAAATLAQEKANIVEELKAERTKKQEALTELEKAKTTPGQTQAPDPEELVNRVLQKKEEESAKQAFTSALEDFKRKNNEFSPETDKAGLAYAKFERELSKFNLSGLKTKEEIAQRLSEVYEFMSKRPASQGQSFHTGTPPIGSDPAGNDNGALTPAEAKLAESVGWDQKKFLEMKAKRPAYVAQLLKFRA